MVLTRRPRRLGAGIPLPSCRQFRDRIYKGYKQPRMQKAKEELQSDNSDKLSLPESESVTEEKLSEATTSTPQSSMHEESLHKTLKKKTKKKKKRLVMKSEAST